MSKIEEQNNKETIVDSGIEKNSLKKKYKSFRARRNEIKEQKKNSVIPLPNNIAKNFNNIPKLKLNLKSYNSFASIENNNKPKRFSVYQSTKFDLKKFKIEKNFAKEKEKEEDSQKENKNLLNKINNVKESDNNSSNNNFKLENINIENNQKIIKVRKVKNTK